MRYFLHFLFVAVRARCAQDAGRLTGTVTDSTGAVVPGAVVNVFLAGGSKAVLSSKTTQDGILNLMPASGPVTYDIAVMPPDS